MSLRVLAITLWLLSVASIVGVAVAASAGTIGNVPLIGNMLTQPHFWDRATPIAILCLFSWVLIELALRARRVFAQHKAIPNMQTLIAQADANRHQSLRANRNETRAVRRANLIIECNRKDPSSLHQALPAAAGLDANTLTAGYVALNVYAWILPVLGFIGTANGMATAIGGFKSALISTNELEKLVTILSQQVIPGLSAAFETTIFALGGSLVAYLCTSALRVWDEEALDSLDRVCVVLLSRIPQPVSIVSSNQADGTEIIAVLKDIQSLMRKLAEAPDKFMGAVTAIERAAAGLNAAGAEIAAAGAELRENANFDVVVEKKKRGQ